MKKIIIIVTGIIFIGCSMDEYDVSNKESANIIFKPYFDQFKKEAEKRGYNFTDYEIDFYLADIGSKSTGGFSDFSNNEIVIDRANWYGIHETRKEQLILQELGHFILNRKHKDRETANGECLSYMRHDLLGCSQNSYSDLWRKYYFDELFDESTPLPSWYTNNNEYNSNYENKEYLVQELDYKKGSYQLDIDTDTISNFVLEVTFKNWQSASQQEPYRNIRVNLNGINYESNPNSNTIFISDNEYTKGYYQNGDYKYEKDTKLSIGRKGDIYSFFFDENLVHITDIDNLETDSITVDFSPGINIDIELFEFDR